MHGAWGSAADFVATACYIGVTALFYDLFKPVNARLSLLAASFNLVSPSENFTCIRRPWPARCFPMKIPSAVA